MMSKPQVQLIDSLQFDDSDFPREAPLRLYEETLLPVLRTNRVVHLRQFVNRLAFDPIPPEIQVCFRLHLFIFCASF
jgi:hypothetical protein